MNFSEWALDILRQEGLSDWEVVPGEAYCWVENKRFTFDFIRYQGNFALWLHEVAHALHPEMEALCSCREPNHYHGGGWASVYARLVQTYMTPKTTVEGLCFTT